MKGFIAALQFLTVLPVKARVFKDKDLANAPIYFPLIGAFLGIVLVVVNNIFRALGFEQFIVSIIVVVSLAIMTGGLHLDGLTDTIDAFSSGRDKEKMLEIMRDSHIGALGALGLISVLLLKIAFLYSTDINIRTPALIIMCVLSRWSMVLTMALFPYARKDGKAKAFIDALDKKKLALTSAITLILAIVLFGFKGIYIMAIAGGSAYISSRYAVNKIGGMTGDTLGAANELTEVMTLFAIGILRI